MFLLIHEQGAISAAADELGLTQSAVSRRLMAFERRLGATLFDRPAGRLRLTPAGTALLPHAQRSVANDLDAHRALARVRDEAGGALSLAIVGTLVGPWLSARLRQLLRDHPSVDIGIETATSQSVGGPGAQRPLRFRCQLRRRGRLRPAGPAPLRGGDGLGLRR